MLQWVASRSATTAAARSFGLSTSTSSIGRWCQLWAGATISTARGCLKKKKSLQQERVKIGWRYTFKIVSGNGGWGWLQVQRCEPRSENIWRKWLHLHAFTTVGCLLNKCRQSDHLIEEELMLDQDMFSWPGYGTVLRRCCCHTAGEHQIDIVCVCIPSSAGLKAAAACCLPLILGSRVNLFHRVNKLFWFQNLYCTCVRFEKWRWTAVLQIRTCISLTCIVLLLDTTLVRYSALGLLYLFFFLRVNGTAISKHLFHAIRYIA